MPNVKLITLGSASGQTVYCIIKSVSNGYYLDNSSGSFVASPVNPCIPMIEDAIQKGQYSLSENRSVWANGEYVVHEYAQQGSLPAPATDTGIGTLDNWIYNDTWAQIEAPIVIVPPGSAPTTYACADIITGALALIGVGRAENLDTTNDIINNIPKLNQIIAKLAMDGLLISQTVDLPCQLTGGIRQYSIGTGQTAPNFNYQRPWEIESAYITDQNNMHYPIEIITREQFNTIVDQEWSMSRPTQIFYDIGVAEQINEVGTIWTYYIPDNYNTYTLHLNAVMQLTGFVNTTDAVNFDIAYMELLQSKMAKRLCPQYGKKWTDELKALDRENENIIRVQNYRKPAFARRKASGVTFNVYTGIENP